MDLQLRGKGVIVTGGSRGIGRATALAFAEEGAQVAICARNEGALRETEAALKAKGVNVYAATCDIGAADELDRFLDNAHAAMGRVDVLVNNASGFGMTDEEASYQRAFNVDLMASVRAGWKVVPWMEAEGGGAILHISSISGLGVDPSAPYAAMKAAMISHANVMAEKLAPKGIRVNSIAPGSIEFEGGGWARTKVNNRARYDSVVASVPFGRLGTPEEVAAAIVFVASPVASWINGVCLRVDGGQFKGV